MRTANNSIQRTTLAIILMSATFGALPTAWAQFKKTDVLSPLSAIAAPASGPQASASQPTQRVRLVDAIAAVVNKEVITLHELDVQTSLVEKRIAAQGSGTAVPPRAALQKQVLENMIVESAQMQMAKEMGMQVDDTMLDRAVVRIAENNKLSAQELRNQIEREGLAFSTFRENIRGEMVRQRLREREVDNKIQITESEIDNQLAAQAGQVQAQQELNIAQIMVRIPNNASPEQISQFQKRANELRAQLIAGTDFAKLAATSSDASDALAGGDMGWRSPDRLPQIFLDAIANLKQGDVSAVIKSPSGFHILKLKGKRNQTGAATAAAVAAPAAIEQTHARHILIKVNQLVTSFEAQRKLVDLKQRLDNKSAKFEDLAKSFSNDGSSSKGGDLGWLYPGDTVPEFERAMNALKPGEVSAPIESPFGFHLIQVVERKAADVSQERQRLAARAAIRERKLEEATQDWLRQVRDSAYVEYRLEEKQ